MHTSCLGKPAVCDKKRQLTYQELLFKVKREAAILQEHGVRCTDKIAVLAVQELNMLFHIWQFNIWEL